MSWETCAVDSDYEIFDEYPYPIRRASNKRPVKEFVNSNGYKRLNLNNTKYYKHRIVAQQWLDNPNNYKYVDHINRDKTDNRIENLHFVSSRENNLNRTSTRNIEYTYIEYDDAPRDLFSILDYGTHELMNYYYSPSQDKFYFDNNIKLRELAVHSRKNMEYVVVTDTNKKQTLVSINKFKELYYLN